MKEETEFERLFGEEGKYTHAQAQSRQHAPVRRSNYASLVEELHAAGIDIETTGNKAFQGVEPNKYSFEIDNDVLSRQFVLRRMRVT